MLALAVYPLRYIETNPLPKGFLPKVGKPPAYAYLYPAEDAALLACVDIPLVLRILYGFLSREGLRAGEALALTWRDIDLERGVVTLDRNKTDDARAWALDPGVTRALRVWRERTDHRLVFVHEGDGIELPGLALKLRGHLKAAGVDRPELHQPTENRGQFRVHDLRGTFVTLSLANGRTETWVADRTGHTSSQMINRYRRAARSAAELGLGQSLPLDWALPEFNPLPGIVAGLATLSAGSETVPPAKPSSAEGGPPGGPHRERRDRNQGSGAWNRTTIQGFKVPCPALGRHRRIGARSLAPVDAS